MSDFNSEDLEKSLYNEVENYLTHHLSGLQQELEKLQDEVREGLARVAGRLRVEDDPSTSSLAAAVAEHIRTAHQRGSDQLAAVAAAARKHESRDVALLKAAIDELNQQNSHAEILNTLVAHAASFAPRVCLFVVKGNNAVGWCARGLENGSSDEVIRHVQMPLSDETILSQVSKSRATWSGAPDAPTDALVTKLGGDAPQQVVAVPLVAREKAVAILYADSGASTPGAVNLEALEMLVRVAGMVVELRAATKRQPTQTQPTQTQPSAQIPSPAPTDAPQVEATHAAALPAEHGLSQTEQATPEVESAHDAPHVDVAHAEPAHPEPAHIEPAHLEQTHFESSSAEPSNAEVASSPASSFELPLPAAFHAPEPAPVVEDIPAPASFEMPAAPAASLSSVGVATAPGVETVPHMETPSQPVSMQTTPLAGRRYGSDVELPIEVSDDERRFHTDARRFARLLVSEIKLYNEQKVKDGRQAGDLYGRLREEIDRSRQMYDKRVSPQVASRYDYFHHELVNALAEGDVSKLGMTYPGAQVAS